MSSQPPRKRRHSPAVYRRRRIVVVVVLLLIIAGIWLLIAQPWRSAGAEDAAPLPALPAPESTTGPSETEADPDASVEPSIDPTATPCVPSDLEVVGLTDKQSYAGGELPQLSIELTNTGDTDCSLNVGTSTQVFTISSGDDVWWRSTDCQSEPSDLVVLLAAGQTVTTMEPIVWERERSSTTTCAEDANRSPAGGGGASYHLRVEIGGVVSTESTQFFLN